MQVSVAPIYDDSGQVIGGVETFRDASTVVHDLERAKAIQQLALDYDLPDDPRVTFTTHYVPHGIVGGLVEVLRNQGYPAAGLRIDGLEKELLRYSNAIRLEDDLTLLEVRLS